MQSISHRGRESPHYSQISPKLSRVELRSDESRSFRVNDILHPASVRWNLGSIRTFPTIELSYALFFGGGRPHLRIAGRYPKSPNFRWGETAISGVDGSNYSLVDSEEGRSLTDGPPANTTAPSLSCSINCAISTRDSTKWNYQMRYITVA